MFGIACEEGSVRRCGEGDLGGRSMICATGKTLLGILLCPLCSFSFHLFFPLSSVDSVKCGLPLGSHRPFTVSLCTPSLLYVVLPISCEPARFLATFILFQFSGWPHFSSVLTQLPLIFHALFVELSLSQTFWTFSDLWLTRAPYFCVHIVYMSLFCHPYL